MGPQLEQSLCRGCQIKMRSYRIRAGSKSTRGTFNTETEDVHMEEEGCVTMEVELGVLQLHAKKQQELPAISRT